MDNEDRDNRNTMLRNVIIGNMFNVYTTSVDDFADTLLKDICFVIDNKFTPYNADIEEHE